jgi:hypothetical protein
MSNFDFLSTAVHPDTNQWAMEATTLLLLLLQSLDLVESKVLLTFLPFT